MHCNELKYMYLDYNLKCMLLDYNLIYMLLDYNVIYLSLDCDWLVLVLCLHSTRYSSRVTGWLAWSAAEGARQTTSVMFSKRTSRGGSAACRRSTGWARRRCWAPGWPSLTPSTEGKRISAASQHGCPWVRCRSSFSARNSCTRCSSRSLGLRKSNISCFIIAAR